MESPLIRFIDGPGETPCARVMPVGPATVTHFAAGDISEMSHRHRGRKLMTVVGARRHFPRGRTSEPKKRLRYRDTCPARDQREEKYNREKKAGDRGNRRCCIVVN